jgi:glycosyltransferase involved in cell wall biosynthesis
VRLLFVTTVYPTPAEPTKGVFNRALVEALSWKHDVRVLAPTPWPAILGFSPIAAGSPGAFLEVPGVEARYPTYYYPPKILRDRYDWFLWKSVRSAARRLLLSWRPDAVIGYWAHPDGAAAVRLARESGVPALVIVGGSDIRLLTADPSRRRVVLEVLDSADLVLTVGCELKARLAVLGLRPEKVRSFYRGVGGAFHPADRREVRRRLGLPLDRIVLLWVGHMVPVKELGVLLDACSLLAQEGRDFLLCLVGDGPLRATLERSAGKPPLAGRVRFVGPVLHEGLPEWYQAADLTVLTSSSEGIPNVLLESLSCGTPFVATNVGGISEVAREPECCLVPPGDAPALAVALGERMRHRRDGTPKQLGVYRWEDSAQAVLDAVRSVVAAGESACRAGDVTGGSRRGHR